MNENDARPSSVDPRRALVPTLRRSWLAIVAALAGVASGFIVTPGLARPVVVGTDAFIAPAPAQLAEARDAARFSLRELTGTDLQLSVAQFNNSRPSADGKGVSSGSTSVGLFYVMADGARVHVWQTDIDAQELAEGGKDPVTIPGSRLRQVPGGDVWSVIEVDEASGHLQMSRRTSDGLTVTIDGRLSEERLAGLAAQLR